MKGKAFASCVIVFMLLVSFSASAAFAQQKREVKFTAKEPVLLTCAGQSADVQMVKVLVDRNKIAQQFNPLTGGEELQNVKSLIIVIGGSTKGMGAAGLDADKEASRIQKLLAKAKELKVPVIGMHIGGKARRGDLSDKFMNLVAPKSSYLIVVKEGDFDEFFSKTAAGNNIPISLVTKISEAQEPLKAIYTK